MKVEVVKHIEIALTTEEEETLCKARNIIDTLMNTMTQYHCEKVGCRDECGDDTFYILEELDSTDTIIDYLTRIKEIF